MKPILGGAIAFARSKGTAHVAFFVSLVLSALMLSGCGQKGPLIQRSAVPASAVPTPATQPPGR